MVKEEVADQLLAVASSCLSPADSSRALPILEILVQRENTKSSGIVRKTK